MADTDIKDLTKYQQLTADIRSWLDSGMFEPGERLPSIADLAVDRGWSREPCARALQILAAEGLLTRYRGLGYCVTGAARQPGKQ
jgi:DNA-binding GntR family transcriptional regulator